MRDVLFDFLSQSVSPLPGMRQRFTVFWKSPPSSRGSDCPCNGFQIMPDNGRNNGSPPISGRLIGRTSWRQLSCGRVCVAEGATLARSSPEWETPNHELVCAQESTAASAPRRPANTTAITGADGMGISSSTTGSASLPQGRHSFGSDAYSVQWLYLTAL
jgi:hypothetical protein